MNGVIFYFLINQSDSCLRISERHKEMRSFALDNDGYFTLPPFKCATSADNCASATWSNEGEFEHIVIGKFEGRIGKISYLPCQGCLPVIHVGKEQITKGSHTHRRRILMIMIMTFSDVYFYHFLA